MDALRVTNPDCRTDISIILSQKPVSRDDYFCVEYVDGTTDELSDPNERLTVLTDSIVVWRSDESTTVSIDDVAAVEWQRSP